MTKPRTRVFSSFASAINLKDPANGNPDPGSAAKAFVVTDNTADGNTLEYVTLDGETVALNIPDEMQGQVIPWDAVTITTNTTIGELMVFFAYD